MKILAIRGQNLASLARAFEIDFVHGPLAGAGLFAITGPVGAGKSTLLDALCLPLFDRTPRLSGRGGPAFGDEGQDPGDWLRGNDPRGLLRRDATEGHAEVDFVGRDGCRYRARWAVRRARRRPDGRLQEQELSLFDLGKNQFVANGRRTEVLAAIEQRLGLDFHQFCRSVLLAQGDFAAFLRASADERARLLENLTGADVYRRLSQAAHQGRQRREQELRTLEAQANPHLLLAAEARHQLEQDVREEEVQLRTCREGMAIARSYVTWYEAAALHRQRESKATVALQAAIEANEHAAPRRERLARQLRAVPVVPRLELVLARQQQLTKGIAEREDAARWLHTASDEAEAVRTQLGEALATWWPSGAAPVPSIVAEFERWQPTLQRWRQLAQDLLTEGRSIERLRHEVATCAEAVQAVSARLRAAEQSVQQAEAATVAATAMADQPGFAALPQLRQELAVARTTLQRQQHAVAAFAASTRDLAAASAGAATLRQQRERLANGFGELVHTREVAHAALLAARAQVEHARMRVGLAQFRPELQQGHACPLCGSASHPSPIEAHEGELASAQQRLERTEPQWTQAREAVVRAESQRAEVEHHLSAALVAEQSATDAAAAAKLVWLREARGFGLPPDDADELDPGDPLDPRDDAEGWLDAARQRFLATEAEFDRLSAAAETARAQRDAAAVAERAARAAARSQHEQHLAAQQRCAAAEKALAQALAQHDRLVATHDELTATLDPAFELADWPARVLDSEPHELSAMAVLARQQAAALQRVDQARMQTTAAVAVVQRLEGELAQADEALRAAFTAAKVQAVDVREVAQVGAEALQQEGERLRQLDIVVERARAVVSTCAKMRQDHEASNRPAIEEADATQAYDDARTTHDHVEKQLASLRANVAADDLLRRQHDELAPRIVAAQRDIQVWRALDDLIGSSTGSVFASFAQGLTLDLLLLEANRRLGEIARRYRLQRIPGGEMDFVVADLDLGGTRRSLQSLSGGETFLVSLALALALATLAAPRSRVETLFLDEGFGTLDAQNLEAALGALDTLQASGCQVGVISHVDGIAERIGCVVEVQPEGGGQSRVLARVR